MMTMKHFAVFMLAAVLLLGALPAARATSAAPGAPAAPAAPGCRNGHAYSTWALTVPPTCEQEGKQTHICTNCGRTETKPVAPLGHDWDEGVVTTDPQYFHAGERTYTCRRDPSHTKTEMIAASAESIFAQLHGNTWSWQTMNIDPLIITEQPVGGFIARDSNETHTLHVAAIGGKGSYTYEWKYRMNGHSEVENIISWLFLHSTGKQTEPDYEAADGNMRYWCVVRDKVGNTATSNTVIVNYRVSIARQPDNVNLQATDAPALSCKAADGSGDYTYHWYNSDLVFQGSGASIPVAEQGDYFCTVEDNVTGETVDTEMCTVYSVKPFSVYSQTPYDEVWDGDKWTVKASFWGGVEPYEVWWTYNGDALDTYEGGKVYDYQEYCADTYTTGDYTVHAVDAMGAIAESTVHRWEKHLTISEQPKGGVIPKDSYSSIRVAVSDGEAPYTYILYRNGSEYRKETYSSNSNAYRVWYPGIYYYVIEDAQGHTGISNSVTFEDDILRIKSQTESAEITKPDGTAKLEVEVEGGEAPYTYTWNIVKGKYWYTVGSGNATTYVGIPGEYLCCIKDKNEDRINTRIIPVTYTGDVPLIIEQPKGGVLEKGSLNLTCKAVSGSGGGLRYEWEKTGIGVRPSWRPASRSGGSTMPFTVYSAAFYRCKVTDIKTGKFVYSQTAAISEALSCKLFGANAETSGKLSISVSVTGGVGPYICLVYKWSPKSWDDSETYVMYKQLTFNTREELNAYTDYYEGTGLYPSSTDKDGKQNFEKYWPVYYIVIIDRNGSKCESNRISYYK